MEHLYECKTIRLENGKKLTSVCTFNNGYSNLCVDDSCWIIIGGGNPSAYISREAMEVLMGLPQSPSLFAPYMKFIGAKI